MLRTIIVLGLLFFTASHAAPTKEEFVAGVRKLQREAKPADRPLFGKLLKAAEAIDDTPASMARYLIEQVNVSDALISRQKDSDVDGSIAKIAEMAAAAHNLKTVGAPQDSARLLNVAAGHAQKLTEKNPNRTDVHYLLASIYYYAGRPTEMKQPLQRCLEIDPNDSACKEKMDILTEVEATPEAAAK